MAQFYQNADNTKHQGLYFQNSIITFLPFYIQGIWITDMAGVKITRIVVMVN